MDRNGFAVVLLFFLIVADSSDASSLLFNLRKFVVTKDSVPGSPVPIPGSVSGGNQLDSKPVKGTDDKEKKTDQNSVNELDKKTNFDPKTVKGEDKDKLNAKPVKETSKDTNSDAKPGNGRSTEKKLDPGPEKKNNEEKKLEPEPPRAKETNKKKKLDPKPDSQTSTAKEIDPHRVNEKSDEKPVPPVPKDSPIPPNDKETANSQPPNGKTEEKKKEDKFDVGAVSDESCDALSPRCPIQNDLVACIKSYNDGSKVVVLVQNKGESNLKATVSAENTPKEIEIPKKKSILVSISLAKGNADILFARGEKNCSLASRSAASEEIPFLKLPSYDKLVTPVNGAYLLIFTMAIFGGTWICIKFSRRRRQGGIPYQELEMALPESVSAADLESAEGWDQGWDDDWDDDNAVKSPGARHVGSISANGLTSRSTSKDGWEDNWDD